MASLKAGDLDQRITFEQKDRIPDGAGGWTSEWVGLLNNPTVWARVRALSAREVLRGMQVTDEVIYEVTIRKRVDLTSAMRVVWRGQHFDIEALPQASGRDSHITFTMKISNEAQ